MGGIEGESEGKLEGVIMEEEEEGGETKGWREEEINKGPVGGTV